jgi:hypothetical protein
MDSLFFNRTQDMNTSQPTYNDILVLMKELSVSQKELSVSQKETDQKFQDTDRKFQDTDREIKAVTASIGQQFSLWPKPTQFQLSGEQAIRLSGL